MSSVKKKNLSERTYGKRFARKTICISKDGENPANHTETLQAWINFIRVRRSLRVKNRDGWFTHKTPAMARGLIPKRLDWEQIPRRRNDHLKSGTTDFCNNSYGGTGANFQKGSTVCRLWLAAIGQVPAGSNIPV
jgi:hypothetical protein